MWLKVIQLKPSSITYANLVCLKSVRIPFLLASLLDLGVFTAGIKNVYENAPITIISGVKLGQNLELNPMKSYKY